MAMEVQHQYVSSLTAPRLARRDLAAFLDGQAPNELIESAILLLDELVTNAVVHVGGPFEVRARLDGSDLHVDVVDAGAELPRIREPGIGGHGLRVVDALAAAWGVTLVDGHGKSTWFEL